MLRRGFLKLLGISAATPIATMLPDRQTVIENAIQLPKKIKKKKLTGGHKHYTSTSFSEALDKEMQGLMKTLPEDLNRQVTGRLF